MKHYFIINPAAGKGKFTDKLKADIISACEGSGADYEIYSTRSQGDATDFVKREAASGEPCRFYACGGDGTISEILNGTALYENAELGVIPIGTGNDFVRNFTPTSLFSDIKAQLAGQSIPCDALLCNGRYAANMINIGFDCEVARRTNEIKRRPYVPSSLAYIFALVGVLIKKPGVTFSGKRDGRVFADGRQRKRLLMAIANAPYCGGGFYALPPASIRDGVMNIIEIKNISRTRFLTLVGSYKNGTVLEREELRGKLYDYRECQSLELSFPTPQAVCIDGEISYCEDVSISCVPGAMRLALPAGIHAPWEASEEKASGRAGK